MLPGSLIGSGLSYLKGHIMSNFSENLKIFRIEKGLSQKELAEKLYMSKQAVSKYECGTNECMFDTLIDIADLFGITVDELVR
jgi:transcriptional regulator with XRE-family HTH domain